MLQKVNRAAGLHNAVECKSPCAEKDVSPAFVVAARQSVVAMLHATLCLSTRSTCSCQPQPG